jgi:hypothetical protein
MFEQNSTAANVYIYGNVFDITGGFLPGYWKWLPNQMITPKNGIPQGPFYVFNNTFYSPGLDIFNDGTLVVGSQIYNNAYLDNSLGGTGSASVANNVAASQSDFIGPFSNVTIPYIGTIAATTNWLLSAGSALRNAGRALATDGYINYDMNGNIRGADGTWDVGAFEYGAASTNPVINVSASSITFPQQLSGTENTLSVTVRNAGGGTLSGTASIAGTSWFSIVGNANYSLASGTGTNIYVRCLFQSGTSSATLALTGAAGASVALSAASTPLLGESFSAISGVIVAPYSTNGGYISQPSETGTADGGTATYWFVVTNTGNYLLRSVFNAPDTGKNSAYVAIDESPTEPDQVWDSPTTTGFATNYVSWRGSGTPSSNEFNPKIWTNLDAGTHYLSVIGREANMQLLSWELVPSGAGATAPVITTGPQNVSVRSGSNATFTVTASGTATLAYQWSFNGTDLSGATASGYTRAAATTNHAGTYSVTVTNSAGSDTASATLTVNEPLSIVAQPLASGTNIQGRTNVWTIVMAGTTPAYQWKKNGSSIAGATASTYRKTNLTTNDNGTYSVVVTNLLNALTSSVATLTIAWPPSITSQPSNVRAIVSSNVTFTVSAYGFAPLSYRWYRNGTNALWSGYATTASWFAGAGDSGSYTVVVTNIAGSVTSSAAILDVVVPPSPPRKLILLR